MKIKEYIDISNYNKFKVARDTENGLEILLEFDELKINSRYLSEEILNRELEIAIFDMNEENEDILESIILVLKEAENEIRK